MCQDDLHPVYDGYTENAGDHDSRYYGLGTKNNSSSVRVPQYFPSLILNELGIKHLLYLFEVPIFKPDETEFFMSVVEQTLAHRRRTKERQNDLIDLLVDAMKDNLEPEKGTADNSQLKNKNKNKNLGEIEELTVTATALNLLVAGYDTTAGIVGCMHFKDMHWLL